ncbi:DNA-binding transcriptional regulator, PucR family [Halobacillus karajensis]|uniref:Carbohydrate diacid transcriptional activator CdaR n=1 Tax=Halobacillus karajensis TaxID=195088 RepID=A0A059NVJ2_9BACI|nr:helix-turn-helix domain-containing protein [Halobacillus karajensis]CDQ18554.1 carbohydrate diacid transcriptional activator CdaR [Halobacillus karajensis]CDQ23374.1 carbohydrate diacid transcriptional activator CdaR [Halobacillus karajensis]CDQ26856.1 carbohydrate diacid transcriptional activator CdaR [Halobacillus karajensis]SEH49989.1 DNA-binding transcriptional regulator, PucR family [Halobacillus karajensis]
MTFNLLGKVRIPMEVKELILQAEDIHKATELISSKLNKPVIIENKNFELISYSSTSDNFDQTQQKTILSKKCPIFILDRLKKEGIVTRLEEQADPIRVNPMEDLGFQQRVVIAANHLGHTMGYVWVQESDQLLEEDEMEFLQEITPHIGKLIYDQFMRVNAKEGRKEELLWQLLHHEYTSESQFRHDASLAKLQIPDRFSVVVFSVTAPQYKYMLDDLANTVERFRKTRHLYYLKTEFQIIMMIEGRPSDRFSSRDIARDLIDEVKFATGEEHFYNFLIGVGKEYTKLYYMRKSFLEALEVIETANFVGPRPETMPREFSKLGLYRYLAALYEKNSSEDYYSEDLLTLIKNDTRKQTELLFTLEAYLANNGKGKQTAKELFIHPNTLNYRIKQIQEMTNIDFTDFNMKAYLYTELLLLNNVESYYERYKKAIQK